MRIIGFGHRKRVGKDSAVKFALSYMRQARPDLKCHILSFGNAIRKISHSMYFWGGLETSVFYENNPHLIENELPLIGRSPRQIWDEVGLMGRGICPKTWVELALKEAQIADILFCKDVRAHTEIDLIDEYNGVAIRIDKLDAPKGGNVDELLSDHKWDRVIDNNGSLKEFNTKIRELCQQLIKQWEL